jgi:hypothetical protein
MNTRRSYADVLKSKPTATKLSSAPPRGKTSKVVQKNVPTRPYVSHEITNPILVTPTCYKQNEITLPLQVPSLQEEKEIPLAEEKVPPKKSIYHLI